MACRLVVHLARGRHERELREHAGLHAAAAPSAVGPAEGEAIISPCRPLNIASDPHELGRRSPPSNQAYIPSPCAWDFRQDANASSFGVRSEPFQGSPAVAGPASAKKNAGKHVVIMGHCIIPQCPYPRYPHIGAALSSSRGRVRVSFAVSAGLCGSKRQGSALGACEKRPCHCTFHRSY